MPTVAEFEEKEYERPLYSELVRDTPQVWTPGQVLEHQLGFDAALNVALHPVWAVLGHPYPLPGVLLRDGNAVGLSAATGVPSGRMPDFRVNLFVQAKRPSKMERRTQGLNRYSIRTPYWRFAIDPAQQSTLVTVADSLAAEAAVVYASPAFNTIDELTRHTLGRSVATTSNFTSCEALSGHRWWAYDGPGGGGFGCSEPEAMEGPDIFKRVAALAVGATLYELPAPEATLKTLIRLRDQLISPLADLERPPARFASFRRIQHLLPEIRPRGFPRKIEAFLEVSLFAHFLNVEWFVVG